MVSSCPINIDEIDVSLLNDTYYRMADLIGLEDTIVLANALEGSQIRIRRYYDLFYDYGVIVSLIGKEKALKVIKAFSGEWIYFTSLKRAMKKQIYNEIYKAFNRHNIKELSKRFGFSARHTQKIIKEMSDNNGQK